MPRSIKPYIVHRTSYIVKELFLCLLCAILLILSFPRADCWILAWFAFVPLFFAISGKPRGRAFLLAYFTGIIFWTGIIYWLVHVTLPGTIVLVLYLALYFGLFGLIISSFTFHFSPIAYFSIPSLWALLEYARSHLLTGFPWALLGYSQYKNLPVIQIADIAGVWGVSFLVMMANVAVYSHIAHRTSHIAKKYILTALCLLLVLGYGYFKIYRVSTIDYRLSTDLKISVLQGNIPQELKWDPQAAGFIVDKYSALTKEAARSNPDLIIWPEASSPVVFGEGAAIFDNFSALAKETNAPLLIGSVSADGERYFNSALLVGRSGKLSGRYDKVHLVPFGEYIPLKKALPFLQSVAPIGDIVAGKDFKVFKLPITGYQPPVTFSTLICFEDLFPELSRRFIRNKAGFLVNITNDAWYKNTSAARQHFQASVFRAVENRVYLARAANTGISGFIHPAGKVISLVKDGGGRELFVDGVDTQGIRAREPGLTFYTKYGDFFPAACFLLLLCVIIARFFRKK